MKTPIHLQQSSRLALVGRTSGGDGGCFPFTPLPAGGRFPPLLQLTQRPTRSAVIPRAFLDRLKVLGGGWWRPLTWVLGILLGGCGMGPANQRNISFDVSPVRDQIVFNAAGDGEKDLYLLDLDTLRVTQITKTPAYEYDPAYSPDGQSILYASGVTPLAPGHLFLRSLEGKPPKPLTSDEQFSDRMPSFSPDGAQITFARAHRRRPYSMGGYVWDQWDVYVMNADGSNRRRLTHRTYYQLLRPQLAADQRSVIFGANITGEDEWNLFAVPVEGEQPPKAITTDGDSYDPGLSRDGQRIVFTSDRAKAFDLDLYLMDLDGTNLQRLTDNQAYNERPAFTRNRQHVLFLSKTGSGGYSLWEVGIASKRLKQIADPSLFDAPLQWRP
jgi:Tol biopolymer transport system component